MVLRWMTIDEMLQFYMGKNTPQRQEFIIDNLRVEKDMVEKESEEGVEASWD